MKKQFFVSAVLSVFCLSTVYTQNSPLYGESDPGSMSCTLINDICQDARGFIWVATEYGLNKFDGLNFTQYLHNENDSVSLSGNNVRRLMLDEDDHTLWIAYSAGLQKLDTGKDRFTNIRFSDASKPHVTDIAKLQSGDIYICTSGRGLYELKKGTTEAYPLEEVNDLFERDFFSSVYEDMQHNIWMGINDYGLLRLNPETKEIRIFKDFDEPGNVMISDIIEDRNGQLYVGTATSIFMFDSIGERFIPIESKEKLLIRRMILSHNGHIFVGTDGQGLKYIDTGSKQLYPVENEHLSFNFNIAKIHALMEDRDKNLWLGCFQKGILMMPNEPTQFSFWAISGKEYKMGGAVTSICKDSQGNVWCSIDNEGIFRFDDKGKLINHFPQPQATVKIFEDSNQTLWVSTYDKGLAQMDKNTGQCRFLPFTPGGYVKAIAEDKEQYLYLSTFGSGFIRYHLPTKKWENFDMEQISSEAGSVFNRWINTIICDSEGLIWFGHYVGVSCYDPKQKRLIKTHFEDILSQQICLSLMEDRGGNIWIGTYNGIFCIHMQTKTIRNYTTGDGLSSNVICGLAEDEKGDIWCSTFQGINQIKVKENRIINYYTGNGLIDKTFNRGVYFQDKEGLIYFGGNTGITLFAPQDITLRNYDREVILTNVYLHNQPVGIQTLSGGKPVSDSSLTDTRKFHFSYEDNTFTFEFSTMDFGNPENIYYEYRLKELSQKWSATQPGINRLTYNHLSPGKYTLEVRACKYGSYSPVRQLALNISPPWYKSSFAYLFYSLLFLALCALIIYLIDRNRKELVNEAKLRFFIDISHEIRSPMTLIISPLEKLMKENHDPETLRTLERIHRNARRILGLINQLLDIRRIDKGQMIIKCNETDMVGFIEELFDVFEDQANRRTIKFTFRHQMEKLPIWIDRNNFDKILMNILSNAFKYTPDKGEITILLTSGIDDGSWGPLRHYAEIRIMDTGTGIDEDKIKKIFTRFYQAQNELTFGTMGSGIGLNLSRTLIELHQGSIHASNRKDAQGSNFIIRIPLGKAHLKKENLATSEPHSRLLLQQETFAQPADPQKKPARSKTNYKILVVDDEDELRDFLHQELKKTYKVLTARNGSEGLQISLSQMPDLIISDVMMPEMDGITFVRKLKANTNISHIPIILLSSKAEHRDRMEGLDKGADAYLSKPFNIEELAVLISNLINTRRILKGKFSGAQDQQNKLKPLDLKSSDEVLMERIMTIINDNIGNLELNVGMLASRVGLSRAQLHRKLKELTGIPAGDFIRNIRLKQAAEFLKGKKMNVSQVAYAVGFANQTHFSTTFKKFYGISPMEYITQSESLNR
ncbi:MAG: response regulator [Tannerellaceae bacterium]|jgi:signal transduction histidine kinase/ligand-binding sensor domain-containing protein/AraC-like DNA-binding protein|nr:response regulator [Tannerellaceae bacterium]